MLEALIVMIILKIKFKALYAGSSDSYDNPENKILDQLFEALESGIYNFKAYVQDMAGNVNYTEEREITVLGNVAPEIVDIEPPSAVTLTADDGTGTQTTDINFNFIVYDANGLDNLPDGQIYSITASGYYKNLDNTLYHYNTKRFFDGGNCFVIGDIDGTPYGYSGEWLRNYSCDVEMYYYDELGPDKDWEIYVTDFEDNDELGASNVDYHETEDVFSLDVTKGIALEVPGGETNSISFLDVGHDSVFGISPDEGYMIMKNIGNVNLGAGSDESFKIYFRGRDLKRVGGSEHISSENFFAYLEFYEGNCWDAMEFQSPNYLILRDRYDVTYDPEEDGNLFPNNALQIPNGNLTLGHAQKNLYYCMTGVDSGIPAGSYTTGDGGTNDPWQITVGPVEWILVLVRLFRFSFGFVLFGVGISIKKKDKKNKKDKFLDIFDEKLKKNFKEKRLTKENLLEVFKEILKDNYDLDIEELLDKEIRKFDVQEVKVPLMIFKSNLSPAEVLCKYLKENKKLRFSEIAKLINRNERTVWINYNNSVKKRKSKLRLEKEIVKDESRVDISVNIFTDRRLSILESVVYYLREKGFRNSEMAQMLDKDQRNISTLYNRVKKKLEL